MYGFSFFIDSIFPYISVPFLIIGILWRLRQWFRVPLPLRIGLAPIPRTQMGVAGRIATEFFLFRTFFYSEQAFWLVIFPFHVVGLLTLVHHALGFGQDILAVYWPFVNLSQYNTALFIISLGAWLLLAFLLYILIRRLYKSDVRGMSFFSDYVAVLLITAVVITGTYMTFGSDITSSLGWHDAAIKWGKGLITFQPSPIVNPAFTTHFMFAQLLFIYFPISKLFHPFGQITSRMMTLKEEPLNLEGVVVK